MTTTTPAPTADRPRAPRPSAGFTLVELMIGATLGSVVLVAVLSAFLFLGRTGMSLRNYSDMEAQARKTIETFAQDARMSSGIVWNSSNSLTLTVARSGGSLSVTYAYDPAAATFTRTVGGVSSTLLTDIRTFTFNAYSIDTQALPLSGSDFSAANTSTKQVQLSLETQRVNRTLSIATNKVISARFVLRNKSVAS